MQIMHKCGVCLRLLVAFSVLSSLEGCRSTRNTMSQVPGMGWMASKEPNVSDWDTEEVSPTKPAVGETPQVASRTKSKSSTSTDPAKDVATSEYNYPDTGYPDPRPKSAQQASASKTEKYDTGKYGTSAKSEVAEASTGEVKNGAVTVPPKRGFYGSEYSEERATTAVDSSSERPTDESTADPRRYSRFTSGEAADESSDDSSLGETARQVARDLKSGYRGAANEARDQLASGTRAIAATPQAMVEDAENTARQAYQKLGQKAVATEDEIVSNYERAAEEVKQAGDNVVQAAESSVKKAAETTDQAVASGVAATGAAVERTYSRFQNRFAESAEDHTEASNTTDTSNSALMTPADGVAVSTSGAEPTVTTQPTKPAVPSSGVGRSTQPWRPGSTSTYSGDTKPTGNDANGSGSTSVEPASYRDTTRSRFSPTYR